MWPCCCKKLLSKFELSVYAFTSNVFIAFVPIVIRFRLKDLLHVKHSNHLPKTISIMNQDVNVVLPDISKYRYIRYKESFDLN